MPTSNHARRPVRLRTDRREQLLELADERGPVGSWLLRRDPRMGRLLADLFDIGPWVPAPRRRLVRADDQLVLELTLHGLEVVDDGAGPLLRRRQVPAHLVAHFPPQSTAEEAFKDDSTTDVPDPLPTGVLPARSRHSGLSRLAVAMPVDLQESPYTIDGVLVALSDWPIAVVPRGLYAPGRFAEVDRLRELADLIAATLPEDKASAAAALATRAAHRVASAVAADPSVLDVLRGNERLAREVEVAGHRLGLDGEATRAMELQAELRYAGALLGNALTTLGPGAVAEVLPGLLFLYVPREPPLTATAIELPYRLVQSPAANAAFSHARVPVTSEDRTELWHTRLGERAGGRVVDATEAPATLAAIWSPDYPEGTSGEPGFNTSLTSANRADIVKLTADETQYLEGGRRRYQPVPVRADRLMLTSLGGWLDVEGRWNTRPVKDNGGKIALVGWKHHTALGRDWFVETVEIGRLECLGHQAVSITQTERRFQVGPEGGAVAVLRRKRFIEVREPIRHYPHPTQPNEGRDFPWATVEILTKRTPNLLDPDAAAKETSDSFWPRVRVDAKNVDFRFELRVTDIGGSVARCDLPLRFISEAVPYEGSASVTTIVEQYNGADQSVPNRTTAQLRGRPVQLAPTANRVDANGAPDPGEVIFPLTEVRFGAGLPSTTPTSASSVRFHPRLETLDIVSTSLQQLTGDTTPGRMSFAAIYRQVGFDPASNKAEILLSAATSSAMAVDFAARSSNDKAGGIVTPSFGVSGTSRALGLVGGDVNLLAGGTFDPGQFFRSAKVFGGVDLKDIIAPVAIELAGAVVPKLKTTRTKEKIETVFEHRVEKVPKSTALLVTNQRGTSKLDIKAQTTAWFKVEDPSVAPIGSGPGAAGGNPPGLKDPEVKSEATLTWFKLNFFGCVVVSFDSFTFKAGAKDGIDCDPKIAEQDGVVFGGPLSFVDGLRRLLSGSKDGDGATPASGGGSGNGGGSGGGVPGFKVTPIFKPSPTGLTVGTKLGVAKIPIGIFTMKNLMVSAAVRLPFDGSPVSLQFGFAERSNPFQLTVSLYGGGGFVVMTLDTEHPVRELEAALEFGAFAELDFGVASGSIYLKAGIYIYFNAPEKASALKGYVEMGGEVQVLGIISVSITLHLSLGYYKVGAVAEVRGQATLVIEIELLFFSTSVNLTVERRFGGSEADPTFGDLIAAQSVWDDYAEAFA